MKELLLPINFQLVLAGMVFFFFGYALAPLVYHKQIKPLTAFPLWIAAKLEKESQAKWNPYLLFLFIFVLNSISLSIDFVSGFVFFLPILLAIWTGLNVGVVTFHTLKGTFYYAALFNPVALFELPAVFCTFALALGLNIRESGLEILNLNSDLSLYLNTFLWLVLPLLLIAAVVEAVFIHWAQKMEQK